MTRETKISLLVGLAFIIVIGILLSDHFRATQELPRAVLTDVGSVVRRATDVPGSTNQGLSFVSPTDSTPKESVPTHDELVAPPSPVVPNLNYGKRTVADNATPEDHGADAPPAGLNEVAQKNGESVESSNLDGTPTDTQTSNADQSPAAPVVTIAQHQYKAGDGDTVSRMAAKFFGKNSRENRQAIIDANPSLREDPDRVIVGKSYVIPIPGGHASASNSLASNSLSSRDTVATTAAGYLYTVKDGDSLWQIANDELQDPSAVQAIKDLNSTVLKGDNHDIVIAGMKLRLPTKPVADTSN
jgi:LysM repeat protein